MFVKTTDSIASGGTYTIQAAAQIPEYCRKLAILLAAQPLFNGSGAIARKSKVIVLDSWLDVRMCGIINANAKKMLGNLNAWHIHEFGNGNYQLHDSNGKWIPQGLTIYIYDKVNSCPVDELEKTYHHVLDELSRGWESSSIKENPEIEFKENEEDFYLFIKKSTLLEEDDLIGALASKFALDESVICHSQWLPECKRNGKIYLWVRKSAFDEVVGKFGFKFNLQRLK